MECPKIINKNSEIIAYLNNLTSCTVTEVINGEYILQLVATLDDLKTQLLYDEENLIEVKGDLFRPLIIEELHTENNVLTVSVECEHISYDLLGTIFETFSYPYTTAADVMNKCLQGTDFTFAGTDVTLKTDINYLEESNAKQISIAIANNWKGELEYHRNNIYLWDRRGKARGVDFRFGKNIQGIKKTIDRSKKDEEGNPTVSYEIDVVELKHLEEYKDLEYFELGDTVRVIDDMLGINIHARIVERVYDVITDTNVEIVLGNILDDIRGSLTGIKKDVQSTKERIDRSSPDWDKIKEITNDLGNVITSKLEGVISTGQNVIQNTSGTVKFTDNGIVIHDQASEETSNWIMQLTAGGWQISDRKDGEGNWEWTTMGTGAGLVAESIVSGELSAIDIKGVDITGSTITGGTLNGVTTNAGTMYVGDEAKGTYLKLAPGQPLAAYRDNTRMLEFWSGSGRGGTLFIYNQNGKEVLALAGGGKDIESVIAGKHIVMGGSTSHLPPYQFTVNMNTTYFRHDVTVSGSFTHLGTNSAIDSLLIETLEHDKTYSMQTAIDTLIIDSLEG